MSERICEADLMIVKSTVSKGDMFGNRGGSLEVTAYIDCERCDLATEINASSEKEAEKILSEKCPLYVNREYEI